MKTLLLAAALALTAAAPATAQVPDTVMEHYRTYAAEIAKAEPDMTVAARAAFKAWKAAEKALGDSKTTGDLAANFAATYVRSFDGRDRMEDVRTALQRSLELASEYGGDDAREMAAQRHVLLAQHYISACVFDDGDCRKAGRSLQVFRDTLEADGWTDRTYYAEALALSANLELLKDDNAKVIDYAQRSQAAYARTTDDLMSVQRYTVPLYHAIALKRSDRPVEAARELQALITDHFQVVGDYTGPSIAGYLEYLDILDELDPDDPRAAELLEWTPPATSNNYAPARRVPPVMPAGARKSGWVHVMYDILENGRVENIRMVDASNRVFRRPALESVEGWIHSPGMPEAERTDKETLIRFILRRSNDVIIPGPTPPVID